MLAGIDLQTGEAISLVSETHNSRDYIEFLKILDNLKVHTSEETRKYLATVSGRFEFVFTSKHGFWLNMVEGFFSKMTKQMLGEYVSNPKQSWRIASICILMRSTQSRWYSTRNTTLIISMY